METIIISHLKNYQLKNKSYLRHPKRANPVKSQSYTMIQRRSVLLRMPKSSLQFLKLTKSSTFFSKVKQSKIHSNYKKKRFNRLKNSWTSEVGRTKEIVHWRRWIKIFSWRQSVNFRKVIRVSAIFGTPIIRFATQFVITIWAYSVRSRNQICQ